MRKQKTPITHTYRVEGTFSYWVYCLFSEDEDCEGECEGHEKIKTIKVEFDEYNEKLAAKGVIDEQRLYYEDACWLVGYPTVTYLHSEFNLRNFWHRKQIEQSAIRKALKEA